MKIVYAGGTGYLGGLLIDHFAKKGAKQYVLTRGNPEITHAESVSWDGKNLGDWTKTLENADVLINLAGKNINTRFTPENKQKLTSSRVQTTELLGRAVDMAKTPPRAWLNASSVAIYNESKEHFKDENSPENGIDFLSQLSRAWENAFWAHGNTPRKSIFRISLVMGESEGSAMKTLRQLVKLGLGGSAGSGEQMVSWISENDFVRAIDYIVSRDLKGAFNFCNTQPLSNAELMRQLRKKYKMPIGLSAPAFAVKMGAGIIGTAPELVLRSQKVFPKRLTDEGFVFKEEHIKQL